MKNGLKGKRANMIKAVLIGLILVIISTGMVGIIVSYTQLNRVRVNEISKTDEDLGIDRQDEEPEEERIINIALFGVDSGREKYEVERSDAIMILTIDEVHKKIKISSILRDSYVDVEGHGKTKINHAYAYGGPQLAIKTLNQNFKLDIRDYIKVDFAGLGSIIDALGGVEIDVKEKEISEVNKYAKEVASIRNSSHKPIKSAGKQLLNGNQATSYARIRAVGNGDFERTERQQVVLNAIISKINEMGTSSYPKVIGELLPFVETSISKLDIVKISTRVIAANIRTFDWIRFPLDSTWKGQMIKKTWYLTYDIEAARDKMHEFIYEDIRPGDSI